MKYVWSKSENIFETSNFVVTNDEDKKIALDAGYTEISDEDYEKLEKHEVCWKEGKLIPYTKSQDEIDSENRIEQIRIKEQRIQELKDNLNATDYKTLKFMDGALTEEEYADTRESRKEWRWEINKLQEELEELYNQFDN